MAVVSVFRDDNVGQGALEKGVSGGLSEIPGYAGSFRVKEVLPVAYEQSWPDGDITPGVCLLTLFQRKPSIDQAAFLDRWHNSHTPLSLRIHPLWHYSRNVVEQADRRTSGQEDLSLPGWGGLGRCWDGIVEEHVRERRDLINPFRFFGPPAVIIQRMIHVYRDTASFLDYKTIETYLTREWILRSGR